MIDKNSLAISLLCFSVLCTQISSYLNYRICQNDIQFLRKRVRDLESKRFRK